MAYYYGYVKGMANLVEIFTSRKKPTQDSHGDKYSSVVGPFLNRFRTTEAIKNASIGSEISLTIRKRNPVKRKIHVTERYVRERVKSPGAFDKRSFRTVDPGRKGYTKLIVGCPKSSWDAKRRRCRKGMQLQAILKERGVRGGIRRNPVTKVWKEIFKELIRMGYSPKRAMKTAWKIYQGKVPYKERGILVPRFKVGRRRKNPGAAWHRKYAEEVAMEQEFAGTERARAFLAGKRACHTESEMVARSRGINPSKGYYVYVKGGMYHIVRRVPKSVRWFMGPFRTTKEAKNELQRLLYRLASDPAYYMRKNPGALYHEGKASKYDSLGKSAVSREGKMYWKGRRDSHEQSALASRMSRMG